MREFDEPDKNAGVECIYFNFPIVLLQGFLLDHSKCLNDIFDYAIYSYLEKHHGGDLNEISEAEKEYWLTIGNKKRTYQNGRALHDSIPDNVPFVGIQKDIWFDYYKNEKSEFQKVCLLAFLAIKSILGKKSYWKTNFKLVFSRMAGYSHTIKDASELPKELIRYYTYRYHSDKIIKELKLNWNLKQDGHRTKGFYVSFKMKIKDLITIVESNRKTKKEKEMKDREKAIRLEVLKELNKK
jgi:hypothetical protein